MFCLQTGLDSLSGRQGDDRLWVVSVACCVIALALMQFLLIFPENLSLFTFPLVPLTFSLIVVFWMFSCWFFRFIHILTCTGVYSEVVILEIVGQMEMVVIHYAEQGGGSCYGFIINHSIAFLLARYIYHGFVFAYLRVACFSLSCKALWVSESAL